MKTKIRRIIRIIFFTLLILLGLFAAYAIVVIAMNAGNRYQPAPADTLSVHEGRRAFLYPDVNMSLICWNIGHCTSSADQKQFNRFGYSFRPDKEQYKATFSAILNIISAMDSVDFLLLQEVDYNSRKSFYTAQDSALIKLLKRKSSVCTINKQTRFEYWPLFNPALKANSGMVFFSRYIPEWAHRIAFPSDENWFSELTAADRCFMIMRYDLENGKDLYIINTQTAFADENMETRIAEWQYLRSYMLDLFSRGHYVIAGGSWNQNPAGYSVRNITSGDKAVGLPAVASDQFFPKGWKWIFDSTLPTERDFSNPYQKGTTPATISDFYICSPNIKVNTVKTIPMDFAHAAHNPVYMNISLVPDSSCCDSTKVYKIMKDRLAQEKKNKKKKNKTSTI